MPFTTVSNKYLSESLSAASKKTKRNVVVYFGSNDIEADGCVVETYEKCLPIDEDSHLLKKGGKIHMFVIDGSSTNDCVSFVRGAAKFLASNKPIIQLPAKVLESTYEMFLGTHSLSVHDNVCFLFPRIDSVNGFDYSIKKPKKLHSRAPIRA